MTWLRVGASFSSPAAETYAHTTSLAAAYQV
eukprot:CAMPEP_0198682814 /NCGR_PEP_ID=MMETSP1468-20131203/9478_1 /TAXON_ID=1461545 /ORGANISM="Mantoniella sp, Strain CCMP1436" /LENGTH=30 /DNA_ID= /DNA_START= /DNA_END= /DNA_ORIENTATION=